MTTYHLTVANVNTRTAITVTVTAASYGEAVNVAWQRYGRRSGNSVVVR